MGAGSPAQTTSIEISQVSEKKEATVIIATETEISRKAVDREDKSTITIP